jgi:hypothetical protein
MAQAHRLTRRAAAAAACAAALAGCATAPPAPAPPQSAAPAAAAVPHDFNPLVLAPFGTPFKEIPGPLTEVLVFHSSETERTGEDADCFRPAVAIAFLGRAPTDHLLCFAHDRLQRIEATVLLPAAEAPALFAAACADWRGAAAAESDRCEGRLGDIAFSARRTADADAAMAALSITLTAAVNSAP